MTRDAFEVRVEPDRWGLIGWCWAVLPSGYTAPEIPDHRSSWPWNDECIIAMGIAPTRWEARRRAKKALRRATR